MAPTTGLANDNSTSAANLITFLTFAGTFVLTARYLNPWAQYLLLADLTAEIRKMWTDYENEGVLPTKQSQYAFSWGLECLEMQVRELVFIPKTSSSLHPRAWLKAYRLKCLINIARNLRAGLSTISEQRRRFKKMERYTEQSYMLEERRALLDSLDEFSLNFASSLARFSHYDGLEVPPPILSECTMVRQSPARSTSHSSIESSDTIVESCHTNQCHSPSHSLVNLPSLDDKFKPNPSRRDSPWWLRVSRSRNLFTSKGRRRHRTSQGADPPLLA